MIILKTLSDRKIACTDRYQQSWSSREALFRLLFIPLLFAGLTVAVGQSSLTLYNMQHVPQSNLFNPAKIPLVKSHFSIPGFAGLQIGAANSSFSYNQFDQAMQNNAYDFDYANLDTHLKSGGNRLVTNNELRILNAGFRIGKGYLHFDVGSVAFASGSYTSDILGMFSDIQGANVISSTDTTINQGPERSYDQSMHQATGAIYQSYSVGYAHQFNSRLSLGGRFRFLRGGTALSIENQGLTFNYPGDGDNFQLDGQMMIYSAGLNRIAKATVLETLFRGGNTGFAFDFGGVFQASEQLELSLSAVNIGQINWKNDTDYEMVNGERQFSAVNIEQHLDQWGAIADSIGSGVNMAENVSFNTPLPQRFFAGATYHLKSNTSLGLLVNATRYREATDLAVALTGTKRIGKVLGLSTAVSYNRYSPINLGLGASLDLGIFQLFATTDNLLPMVPGKKSKVAQFQMGISFNFGKMNRDGTPFPAEAIAMNPDSLAADTLVAEAVDTLFFNLSGLVRDASSNEAIMGIKSDIYSLGENGEKELFYTNEFQDGMISVQLKRGMAYEMTISRAGYKDNVILLDADLFESEKIALKRDFILQKNEPQMEVDKPIATTTESQQLDESQTIPEAVTEEPDYSNEVMEPEETDNAQTSYGTYRLIANTSFRPEPDHRNTPILRLRPPNTVEVLEKTNKWWWKVNFQGREGYVKALLLEK